MTSVNLTPREHEILVAFVTEVKGEVNWDKVAAKAKCTTAKYARDKFGLIRNKLVASVNAVQANGTAGTATPKSQSAKKATSSKRKKDDDDEEATPTKKRAAPRKPRSATPAKKKSATPDGGDDGEEGIIKAEPIEPDEPNGAGEMMDDMETTT